MHDDVELNDKQTDESEQKVTPGTERIIQIHRLGKLETTVRCTGWS
jgi:hypothetical protein